MIETQQLEEIGELVNFVDTDLVKPLKETYYDYENDTFSTAYNLLSDTKQLRLLKINTKYDKFKIKYAKLVKFYKEFKVKAVKNYVEYYKTRRNLIKVGDLLKTLPRIVKSYKTFKH